MDWSDAPPETNAWLARQKERLEPQLRDTAFAMVQLDGSDDDVDPRWCVELGYLIMLNKPILVMKPRGSRIPLKLRQVADEIVDYDPALDLEQQPLVEAKVKAFDKAHS